MFKPSKLLNTSQANMNALQTLTVLVTGGRGFTSRDQVYSRLNLCMKQYPSLQTLQIVHGGCPTGADRFAADYCKDAQLLKHDNEKRILVKEIVFPANWKQYGLAAGPIRNQQMVDYCNQRTNMCLAFHDDLKSSKGTLDTVRRALKQKIRVYVLSSKSTSSKDSIGTVLSNLNDLTLLEKNNN